MMKRGDEIAEKEALKRKYEKERIQMVNYESNKTEYMYVFSF